MSLPPDSLGLDFRALAEFHCQIRRFVKASANGMRGATFDSLQHQLVLSVRGLPPELKPTITSLAKRLQIRHRAVVGLVNRCVERGLVERRRDKVDRRQVTIHLTPKGSRLAREIARRNSNALHMGGRELLRALHSLFPQPPGSRAKKPRLSHRLAALG